MTSREQVIADISAHPERHRHDFDSLQRCCTVDGALDLSIMEAHSAAAPLGRNGGRACDVTAGPCSCGAWH